MLTHTRSWQNFQRAVSFGFQKSKNLKSVTTDVRLPLVPALWVVFSYKFRSKQFSSLQNVTIPPALHWTLHAGVAALQQWDLH